MRLHPRKAAVVAALCIVGVIVAVVFLHPGWLPPYQKKVPQSTATATNNVSNNLIKNENAFVGTREWIIPEEKDGSSTIQAYANAASVQPGQTLTFYVSTIREGTPYSLNIYRLGWYGGAGARQVFSRAFLIGHAQGYYNASVARLVACPTCLVDTHTGLVEARWQPSYVLTVPMDWVTGIYLTKFIDNAGLQTYVPFDVRGNSHARYVIVTPDTTYQAYNQWGGYSLYWASNPIGIAALTRGVKVSFNRPYAEGYGASQILGMQLDAIRWLERQGYDLSYVSDIDLQRDPRLLLDHQAYISIGHDEYWTKEMRDGVEYARDHGVGLAFLGANTAYWQIRLTSDAQGNSDRTIICYKVQTGQDLFLDPFYGQDNTRVTAQWRDPVLNRPENALIGVMFSHFINQSSPGYPWQVSLSTQSFLLDNTQLLPGQVFGCNLVGYEWDHVFNNGFSPPDLQIVGASPTVDDQGQSDISNTTYYIASSGAIVFASGSTYWTTALDDFRFYPSSSCAGQENAVPEMQSLMANVMIALVTHHTK